MGEDNDMILEYKKSGHELDNENSKMELGKLTCVALS